jgi:hypothetical protein
VGEEGLVLGLNAPADMRLAPNFFAMLGARWIRVVLLPDVDLTPWIQDAHSRGLKVLGVIARESIDNMSFSEAAKLYSNRYGQSLSALQCGNEPDHESESSWTMTQSELNGLLATFDRIMEPDLLVGPGLVSGDPHWLDSVDTENLMSAIAVHPYGQRPDNLQDWSETPGNFGVVGSLLDSYRYHNRPIWVTEVGVSTTQVSHAFQARYTEAMLKALKLRSDVPVVTWFCADDAMVKEFGLYDINGSPKVAATSFMKVAGAQEPEPTVTVKAIDVSSHQPANLDALIAQHQAKHVIVKLYMPWESVSFDHSNQQVNSARMNHCSVGGYVWAYRSQDPIATINNVIALCASIGLELPLLWIDCETYEQNGVVVDPGPDAEWLARAVDHAERVYGMKCGIYTGRWWVRDHFPGGEAEFSNFSRLPLWLSEYDGNPDINDADTMPQGWTSLACKQYTATPIDQNSIRPEYTVYEGGSQPPPDPCEHFRTQLDAWINAKPFKSPSKKKLVALRGGQ